MNQTEGLHYAERSLEDTVGFLTVAANQIGPISRTRTQQIMDLIPDVRALQEKIRNLMWTK